MNENTKAPDFSDIKKHALALGDRTNTALCMELFANGRVIWTYMGVVEGMIILKHYLEREINRQLDERERLEKK